MSNKFAKPIHDEKRMNPQSSGVTEERDILLENLAGNKRKPCNGQLNSLLFSPRKESHPFISIHGLVLLRTVPKS